MTDIITKDITCKGGMPAFIAAPKTDRKVPAIVILHERYGLVQHTKDLAMRHAREGLVCIAGDYFFRHPDQAALCAFEQEVEKAIDGYSWSGGSMRSSDRLEILLDLAEKKASGKF